MKKNIPDAVGFVVTANMAIHRKDEIVSEPYLAEGFSEKDAEGPRVPEESELQPEPES